MYNDEELLPDLTPEENAELERQFYHGLMVHTALQLRARAQAMEDHAKIHRAVSKTIIESVIGGKRYIGIIWDGRTQGTHGILCEQLIIQRYDETETERPKDFSRNYSGCLTEEELANVNSAAQEFAVWLADHRPVYAGAAVNAFVEIGQRHQSTDHKLEFIMTLPIARMVLADLAREGL